MSSKDIWMTDSDSHIEEPDAVWDHLDPAFADRRPQAVGFTNRIRPNRNFSWLIDGALFPKPWGHGAIAMGTPPLTDHAKGKPVAIASQTLEDPAARIADMDRQCILQSVLYPTLFLQNLTDDLAFEAALMRAYNDYMAEQCAAFPERLFFAAPVGLRHVPGAIGEMRRAKALGAVAVMVLGTAGNRFLHDPLHDPFWQACVDEDMPVAVHVGWGHDGLVSTCDTVATSYMFGFDMSVLMGAYSMFGGGILDRFPDLRVAFIEGSTVLYEALFKRLNAWYSIPTVSPWGSANKALDYVKGGNVAFSCEGDEENLAGFAKLIGTDKLMIAADFPHIHFEGGQLLKAYEVVAQNSELTDHEKILVSNAKAFYRLPALRHRAAAE